MSIKIRILSPHPSETSTFRATEEAGRCLEGKHTIILFMYSILCSENSVVYKKNHSVCQHYTNCTGAYRGSIDYSFSDPQLPFALCYDLAFASSAHLLCAVSIRHFLTMITNPCFACLMCLSVQTWCALEIAALL